ncbi:hypothetical protein HDU83_000057 [Entophlyctis luteolus]|nr:hypothetical protein HDU83_000057 [Entophlyctis luteolus]
MSDVCIGSSVNDTPAHESSRVTSNNPTAVDKTNPRAMFESAFEVWHNVGWKDLNENKTLRDLEQKVEGWLTQMNLPVPRNTLCAWFKEMAAIYPVGFGEWFEKSEHNLESTNVDELTAITKFHSPTKTSPNAVRLGAQEGTTPASTSDPAPTISNLPPAALQRDAKSSNGKPPRKSSSGEERMPGGKALKAARAPTEKKLYYVRHPPQSMPGSGTSSCARNLSHQKPEKQGVPCHPNTDNRSNLSNSFDNELLAKSASNNQNRLLSDQTFMTQPLNKLYFMPLDIRGQISNANQYQNMIPATSSDIMSSAGGHPIVTELSPIQTTANNSRNPCLMHHIPQPQSKGTIISKLVAVFIEKMTGKTSLDHTHMQQSLDFCLKMQKPSSSTTFPSHSSQFDGLFSKMEQVSQALATTQAVQASPSAKTSNVKNTDSAIHPQRSGFMQSMNSHMHNSNRSNGQGERQFATDNMIHILSQFRPADNSSQASVMQYMANNQTRARGANKGNFQPLYAPWNVGNYRVKVHPRAAPYSHVNSRTTMPPPANHCIAPQSFNSFTASKAYLTNHPLHTSSSGKHPCNQQQHKAIHAQSQTQTTANSKTPYPPALECALPTRSEHVDTISQEKQKPCYDSSNNDMNNISTSQNNRQISEAPKLFSSTGKMRKRDPAKARQIAVAAIKMYSSMQKQAAQYRRRMELSNPFTISPNYPGQCDRYRYFQPYQLPVGVGYSGGGSSVRVDESPQYKAVQKMFDIIIGECVTGLERAIGYDGVDREILIGPDSVRKSSTDTASASDEWDRWRIDPEHELRFEVGIKESIVLKITSELAPDIEYTFSAQKIACFSWRGCEAMTKGKCGVAYTAGETPMHQYLNVHLALEAVRKDAASFSTSSNLLFGPKVMIVGPSDVGKSTLAKILVNYSIKLGHLQMYADIDIGEASLSLPGCLTANVFSRAVDIEEGMGGAMSRSGAAPMCFYYGYGDISDKPKLYQKMMERLSEVIDEKLKKDASVRTAGIVFDTPAQFSEPIGYELMNQAISLFKPTVILVLGHERLYADLSRRLKDGKEITVLKLAKSGGVVTRDKAFRRAIQSMKIREYFYGTPKFPLNPASNTVGFHELTVRRVGDTTLAPSSALPLGQERKVQETKIVKMEVGDTLLNSILAVSHADRLDASAAAAATVSAPALTADEETALILEKNVAGFVYVSEVDDVKKKLTVLAPNPGRLPKKYMVMGSLKWVEMN